MSLSSEPLLSQDDVPLVWATLGLTFHLERLTDEDNPRLEQACDLIWAWLGERVRWCWDATTLDIERCSRKSLEFVSSYPTFLNTAPLPERSINAANIDKLFIEDYFLRLTGGENQTHASPWSFHFWTEIPEVSEDGTLAPLSFFKVTVPVDVDLEAFAALFDALRKVLRIRWGNAGYTYSSWEVLERYAGARAIYAHARRYCGFDVGQSVRQLERFCDAIRTVNWLTAAGPELTAKLEAVRPVGLDASNLITVLRDEHGLLVRAGQTPQIGDVNRLEFPPPYAASDRLLRPIRATQANFLGRWDERSTEAWLSRFERSST